MGIGANGAATKDAANGHEDWIGRADYFKAIAAPERLAIVEGLDEGVKRAGGMRADEINLDMPDYDAKKVAGTLKKLESAGLVESTGEGDSRKYALSRIGRALARASKTFLASMKLGRAAAAEGRAQKASRSRGKTATDGGSPKSKDVALKPAGKSRAGGKSKTAASSRGA